MSLIGGIAAYYLSPVAGQQQIVLGILFFIGLLWFTEALPLHVSGLLAAFLLVVLAGFGSTEVLGKFFDPVIALFLGGFILARAMQKHKLDEKIALLCLTKIGASPKKFLLGLMLISAFLSMWMSNTAATAIMLPIAIAVLVDSGVKTGKNSKASKAFVLGIAFAATIGGMATLVGSPPNAITVSFLHDAGIDIDFVGWMYYGLPIAILMLPISWLVLLWFYKPELSSLKCKAKRSRLDGAQKQVLLVFILTVALWLTTRVHGISSSLVALIPIFLLYFLGLLDTSDFSKISWPTLILFGGGLSLGYGIDKSGLSTTIANFLNTIVAGQALMIVFFIVIIFAVILTLIGSNTAIAAIIVPIMIPLALTLGIDLKTLALLAGLGVSLDFIVPVGTPPSAIAYSSGYITVKDMALPGIVITIVGAVALTLLGTFWF